MLIFIPSFRKEVINASKSIARLAIHCHEQQDFVDLQTITVCMDIDNFISIIYNISIIIYRYDNF